MIEDTAAYPRLTRSQQQAVQTTEGPVLIIAGPGSEKTLTLVEHTISLITGFDYKAFEKRHAQKPNQPVERLLIVCMRHEPDLKARLQEQLKPFQLNVEIVDILRDKSQLGFKRESEAQVVIRDGQLVIEQFYPMNLLQKLSLMKENVDNWRELVESVMIDFYYDGAVLEPSVVDIPEKKERVQGKYPVPKDAGNIRVKITDLLSESLEVDVA